MVGFTTSKGSVPTASSCGVDKDNHVSSIRKSHGHHLCLFLVRGDVMGIEVKPAAGKAVPCTFLLSRVHLSFQFLQLGFHLGSH